MYGGYFTALAVTDGEQVIACDNGTDSYAQYVIYKKGKPVKVVLINTDYYSGEGLRSQVDFTVTGLKQQKIVTTLRMTAANSEVYTGQTLKPSSQGPTIGGVLLSSHCQNPLSCPSKIISNSCSYRSMFLQHRLRNQGCSKV
jgi:hypothetical protein